MSILSKQPERLVIFDAVMREGSLSGAARALRLSQPTVRRAIEALEAASGIVLFTRSDNGLTPTEQARHLWPLATSVVELTHAFERSAQSDPGTISGTVRVTASRVIAQYVLPSMIAELLRHCPALRLEVVPDDRTSDLLRRSADIAIRHVPPRQLALTAQKVKPLELGVFARPVDTDPMDSQDSIERLLAERSFVWEDRDTSLANAATAMGFSTPAKIAAATDDQALQIALVDSGAGIGICQVGIAKQLGLTRLANGWAHELPVWIVAHEDQLPSAHIRRTFDGLVSAFQKR